MNLTYSQIMILQSEIKNELTKRFPYSRVHVNKFGGQDKATIIFEFSIDRQSAWENNDYENSRRYMFSVTYKGDVDCIYENCFLGKVTKFNAEPNKLLYKITKMLDGIKQKASKKQAVAA